MRYLVTGGAGFIGSHTVDELVKRGHRVVVLDDLSTGKAPNIAEVGSQIEFMRESITNLNAVREACRAADCVIHLAAQTSVPRSVKDPIETNLINVNGTLNVLVAARDAKVKRIVFASSCAVYGITSVLPIPERHGPRADFSLRPLQTGGRGLRPLISGLVRRRIRFAAVFQRVRTETGSGLAVFRSPFDIQRGTARRNAHHHLRRRRAVARLRLRAKCGGRNLAIRRSHKCAGFNSQHRHRKPVHTQSNVSLAGKNHRPPRSSNTRCAARGRHSRFAGGHHTRATCDRLSSASRI